MQFFIMYKYIEEVLSYNEKIQNLECACMSVLHTNIGF